jgi:outer membrane biosynthesis protein TonB
MTTAGAKAGWGGSIPFNPGGVGNLSQTISLSQTTTAATGGYNPPQITAASYATYPVDSIASGAVVLDVTIRSTGKIAKVRVVRDLQSLTPQATKAVKVWTFSGYLPRDADGLSHSHRVRISISGNR